MCIVAVNPDYTGTELVIPRTVNYEGRDIEVVGIAPEAFKGNTNITSVSIPNTFPQGFIYRTYTSPTGYHDLCGANMFADCTNLTKVVFADGLKYFTGETPFRNCPIAEAEIPASLTDLNTFLEYSAVKTIDIPETVTNMSFRGCSQLTEIPALLGMTTVPQYCFRGCSSLVNVTLPANATLIHQYVLLDCTSLETLVVPDKVTEMLSGAVKGCTSLRKVTLGSSLDIFASGVFGGCNNIELIEFKSLVPPHFYQLGATSTTAANAGIFTEQVFGNALVKVPEGALPAYQKEGWFQFSNAEETTTGVEGITVEGNEAAAEYYNLQGVQVSSDALVPGIYIVRRGNTTAKIVVR